MYKYQVITLLSYLDSILIRLTVTMASKSQSSVPSEGCILLIPWDTTSPDHVERMIQQRIACGWDYDASIVQDWKSKQEAGKLNLQWIVHLPPSSHSFRISQHVGSLTQSCIDRRAPPKTHHKISPRSCIASQHCIILRRQGTDTTKPTYILHPHRTCLSRCSLCALYRGRLCHPRTRTLLDRNLLHLSRFAVSGPWLHDSRHCREDCDFRALKCKSPNTQCNQQSRPRQRREVQSFRTGFACCMYLLGSEEKSTSADMEQFSNQEWYERRGFKVYRDVGKLFSKVDSTGKTWSWDAVFMRKDLL